MILEDTAAFQVLFIFSIPGYFVLGTSLLWRSTVAFTYLKVKSAKCLCLRPVVLVLVLLYRSWSWSCKQRSWPWSCYFGLGLKNLVLFTSLPESLLVRLDAPSPRTPLRSRPSASIFGPSGLIRQLLPTVFIPPMHRGLGKNTGNAHYRSQISIKMQDSVLKIYKKKSGGRDPRTPAAKGESFVRTHPRAHLPDAGAPPLLLGWLRPCVG